MSLGGLLTDEALGGQQAVQLVQELLFHVVALGAGDVNRQLVGMKTGLLGVDNAAVDAEAFIGFSRQITKFLMGDLCCCNVRRVNVSDDVHACTLPFPRLFEGNSLQI